MFRLNTVSVRNANKALDDRGLVSRAEAWVLSTLGITRRRLQAGLLLAAGDTIAVMLAAALVQIFISPAAGPAFNGVEAFYPPIFIACCFASGLYRGFGPSPFERFKRRIWAILLFVGIEILVCSFFQSISSLLLYILGRAVLALPLGCYIEIVLRRIMVANRLWGAPSLIVGQGEKAAAIAELLRKQPELGFRLAGDRAIEAIILTSHEQAVTLNDVKLNAPRNLHVLLAADLDNVPGARSQMRMLGNYFALELPKRRPSQAYCWLKRILDLALAVPAAIIALPLVGMLAAAIKIADPGPVFYVQKRVGRYGRIVSIIKIRSMFVDAEKRLEQHLRSDPDAKAEWERYFKLRNDPRILPKIGHLIRRTSLDELPQLWNIIRGDMTLVGPRPFPAYHLDSFDSEFRQARAMVTPGLTGLWQISERSNGDLDAQKALDLLYIENQSLWLDLYILIQTVPAVLGGSGAR